MKHKDLLINHGNISQIALRYITITFIVIFLNIKLITPLSAQSEVMAWGNLTGIRVDGQLMDFESSMRVVEKGWTNFNTTGREKQRPKYHRDEETQTITTTIGKIQFSEVIKEAGTGSAIVTLKATAALKGLI